MTTVTEEIYKDENGEELPANYGSTQTIGLSSVDWDSLETFASNSREDDWHTGYWASFWIGERAEGGAYFLCVLLNSEEIDSRCYLETWGADGAYQADDGDAVGNDWELDNSNEEGTASIEWLLYPGEGYDSDWNEFVGKKHAFSMESGVHIGGRNRAYAEPAEGAL